MKQNKKLVAFMLALILPGLFLWSTVFTGASAFNLVPYEVHEAISPGGATESDFIVFFDVLIALLLIIPGYKIAIKLMSR